jgi:hypothetical protein
MKRRPAPENATAPLFESVVRSQGGVLEQLGNIFIDLVPVRVYASGLTQMMGIKKYSAGRKKP